MLPLKLQFSHQKKKERKKRVSARLVLPKNTFFSSFSQQPNKQAHLPSIQTIHQVGDSKACECIITTHEILASGMFYSFRHPFFNLLHSFTFGLMVLKPEFCQAIQKFYYGAWTWRTDSLTIIQNQEKEQDLVR